MKKLILLSVLFASLNVCIAQKRIKLTEYPASNGINYKLGDKVKMYKGSGANGNFVNLYLGGWGALAYGSNAISFGAGTNGLMLEILKIERQVSKRWDKVYFTVAGGNISNYILDIEGAIISCEIEDCKKEVQKVEIVKDKEDKYDKLAKLKKLLDDGVISSDEFEKEKKKILEE
jgi:hypothetical protein